MSEQEMMLLIMKQLYGQEPEKWDGGDRDDPNSWNDLVDDRVQLATFGAGCFWGTDKFYARDFAKKFPGSILGTSVGFMNPDPNGVQNPSYEDVCEGTTGHVEVL